MDLPQRQTVPASAWFGPSTTPVELTALLADLGANNGVAVLTWPRDERHLDRLDAVGVPALLLVPSTDVLAPPVRPLHDWTRTPTGHEDIHRRLLRLCRLAAITRLEAGPPVLARSGRLLAGPHHIDVPHHLIDLAHPLVSHFEEPVSQQALLEVMPSDLRSRARLAARVAGFSEVVNALGLVVVLRHDTYEMRRCWAVRQWITDPADAGLALESVA